MLTSAVKMDNVAMLLYINYFLFYTDILLIITLFAYSLQTLVKEGRILVLPNLIQPVLFCLLFVLIYAIFGRKSYHFDREPIWFDWIIFTLGHILRATDILDAVEESRVNIQNIKHASNLVTITIITMHWMIDIFLVGLLWKVDAKYFKNKFLLIFSTYTFRLFLVLALFIPLSSQAIAEDRSFAWFIWNFFIAWPLDNIIRILDIGDTLQLYNFRLHEVKMTLLIASLNVVFRFFISIPVARFINSWRMLVLPDIKSIDDLIPDLAQEDTAKLAMAALHRKGVSSVPALIHALINPNADIRSNAAMVLGDIANEEIILFFNTNPDTQQIIFDLSKALVSTKWYIRRVAADNLGYIGASAKSATSRLIMTLIDEIEEVRKSAENALNRIDTQWPITLETNLALLALTQTNSSTQGQHNLFEIRRKLDVETNTALSNLVDIVSSSGLFPLDNELEIVTVGLAWALAAKKAKDKKLLVKNIEQIVPTEIKSVIFTFILICKDAVDRSIRIKRQAIDVEWNNAVEATNSSITAAEIDREVYHYITKMEPSNAVFILFVCTLYILYYLSTIPV